MAIPHHLSEKIENYYRDIGDEERYQLQIKSNENIFGSKPKSIQSTNATNITNTSNSSATSATNASGVTPLLSPDN